MGLIARVLDQSPVSSLDDYIAAGGGDGLDTAHRIGPPALIAQLLDAGVRGRGGAGFPTGVKWRTVAANASPLEPSTVVVNAAEGEPGSFKDREILRSNPYRVLEGALIAAHAVGADKVIVGMKRTDERDIAHVRAAIDEAARAGWTRHVGIEVVEGPPEYLLGEETGLLEVIDGRAPFPRIDPPYRRGVDEVVEHPDDVGAGSSSAAHVEMAAPGGESFAPPTLVDNVETLAHAALVFQHGVDWFRAIGTPQSPGSFVCTVSGHTARAGVAELEMGTTLREAIELVGGGMRDGRPVGAVLQGVSAAVITADQLDTPLTWEDMAAIGSGLGAAAFIVFDDRTEPIAIARAVSRFLAVESCGQCTPCKQDGLAIANALDRGDLDTVRDRLVTVADSARCSLATQHQVVVGSLVERLALRAGPSAPDVGAVADVLPVDDLAGGTLVLDTAQRTKQPDWTFEPTWSGESPADRYDEHRAPEPL